VNGKALAHFRARFGRRRDQDSVERGPSRSETDRHSVYDKALSAESEVSGILDERRDRRAARRENPIEQSPLVQAQGAVAMDEVPVRYVARKPCSINEQDVQPATRKQHRGRSASTKSADDDRVEHGDDLSAEAGQVDPR
jgi:hypothetical protein